MAISSMSLKGEMKNEMGVTLPGLGPLLRLPVLAVVRGLPAWLDQCPGQGRRRDRAFLDD